MSSSTEQQHLQAKLQLSIFIMEHNTKASLNMMQAFFLNYTDTQKETIFNNELQTILTGPGNPKLKEIITAFNEKRFDDFSTLISNCYLIK